MKLNGEKSVRSDIAVLKETKISKETYRYCENGHTNRKDQVS